MTVYHREVHVRAAQARERATHRALHRRPRHAHVLRGLAIITSVLILWAVSWAACYRWLAPFLVGVS